MLKLKTFLLFIVSLPVAAILLIFLTNDTGRKTTVLDKASATVKITTFSENSGGTGVIYISKDNESYILTNRHVCEAIKKGGLVITNNQEKHVIVYFKQSIIHDLCLLSIAKNLNVHTNISTNLLNRLDKVTVSGHPALYPTTITEGYYSGRVMIDVLVGMKVCSKEDYKDASTAFSCAMSGGFKPDVKQFDAQIVSATIMAGSSGSAVYDDRGEIIGLIFAGQKDFGYGFMVPLEYIHSFLEQEISTLALQRAGS